MHHQQPKLTYTGNPKQKEWRNTRIRSRVTNEIASKQIYDYGMKSNLLFKIFFPSLRSEMVYILTNSEFMTQHQSHKGSGKDTRNRISLKERIITSNSLAWKKEYHKNMASLTINKECSSNTEVRGGRAEEEVVFQKNRGLTSNRCREYEGTRTAHPAKQKQKPNDWNWRSKKTKQTRPKTPKPISRPILDEL